MLAFAKSHFPLSHPGEVFIVVSIELKAKPISRVPFPHCSPLIYFGVHEAVGHVGECRKQEQEPPPRQESTERNQESEFLCLGN